MSDYDREAIRIALTEQDNSYSHYLDMETGKVVRINDTDPNDEATREQVFAGYGDRFRYIPGGKPSAGDAEVQQWLEAEGL